MKFNNHNIDSNLLLYGISGLVSYIGMKHIIDNDTKITFCKEISTNHITIYKAPLLDESDNKTNRTGLKKYYDLAIKNFIEIINSNMSGISLNIFYNNLKTLKFNEHNKRIKGSNKNVIGNYIQDSTLINLLKEDKSGSIYHELLHSASTYSINNILYSGFKQTRLNRSGYDIGEAFNEGYTALLEERLFGEFIPKKTGYLVEKTIVSLFENIVGKNLLESLYFKADLYSLVENVRLFKEEDSLEFLKRMDYIKNIRIKKFKSSKEIKYSLESLEYIGYFLLSLYIERFLCLFEEKSYISDAEANRLKTIFNSFALQLEREVCLFGKKCKILSRQKSEKYIEDIITSRFSYKLIKRN